MAEDGSDGEVVKVDKWWMEAVMVVAVDSCNGEGGGGGGGEGEWALMWWRQATWRH